VGDMFAGGMGPGVMLATLYILYVGIRSYFQPELGPALPKEERASLKAKIFSLKAVILPIFLILIVLGSIYAGVCTPTEASAVGALGSFICATIYKRLTWPVVKKATTYTFMLTGMVLWILLGASIFNSLYRAVGAQDLIMGVVSNLNVSPWGVLLAMQLSLFILGMLMDDFAVVMLCAPIFVPIVSLLGFNTLWFAILFMVNMQMAYLTPPYGFNLFYMKSIVPEGITMGDIYRGVLPFVGLQMLALILLMLFPQIALWIPTHLK